MKNIHPCGYTHVQGVWYGYLKLEEKETALNNKEL